MPRIFVQFDVFHVEMSELKAEQPLNMQPISVQFDVIHAERSELKAEQPSNMQPIFTDSPPLRIACPTSAAPAFTSSIVTSS